MKNRRAREGATGVWGGSKDPPHVRSSLRSGADARGLGHQPCRPAEAVVLAPTARTAPAARLGRAVGAELVLRRTAGVHGLLHRGNQGADLGKHMLPCPV
jgi:hypothetical protein